MTLSVQRDNNHRSLSILGVTVRSPLTSSAGGFGMSGEAGAHLPRSGACSLKFGPHGSISLFFTPRVRLFFTSFINHRCITNDMFEMINRGTFLVQDTLSSHTI